MIPGSASPLLLKSVAGYQIERSLRFNSSDSAYLSRTPAVAGNRTTWTWAGWVKASEFGADDFTLFSRFTGSGGNYYTTMRFNQQILRIEQASGIGYEWYVRTTRVFRDPSAWYHIVVAINTNLADADTRVKLYVNGVEESAANFTRSNPARYSDTWINTTSSHSIGEIAGGGYFNGYLADIYFIDGQQLTPSSFTEVSATTGQLIPKTYSGSYGTNGFQLKFADNSSNTAATLGKDTSGNSNNWTPNNLSVTAGAGNDSLVDTPTSYGTPDTGVGNEVRGNYATLNPLDKGSSQTTANGNLDISGTLIYGHTKSTLFVSSGKWYFEYTLGAFQGDTGMGLANSSAALTTFSGENTNSVGYLADGRFFYNSASTSYSSYTTGDVIGIAFDCDTGKIWIAKNNTWQNSGNPAAGTGQVQTVTWSNFTPIARTVGSGALSVNFGQRAFAYTAPSGFKALCDTNIPEGTITTSGTFTGNASADGPFVYLNGVPTAMTINSNAVTFATHADKLSNGFKLRTSSGSYNTAGSNSYSITTTGAKFKYARAQPNP